MVNKMARLFGKHIIIIIIVITLLLFFAVKDNMGMSAVLEFFFFFTLTTSPCVLYEQRFSCIVEEAGVRNRTVRSPHSKWKTVNGK